MVIINEPAPDFSGEALVNNEIKKIKLEDYKGKWVVLFFYPADFTFICPTELGELADNYEKIKELANICINVEKIFDYPQDIEWCIYNNKIWLLQSRATTFLTKE